MAGDAPCRAGACDFCLRRATSFMGTGLGPAVGDRRPVCDLAFADDFVGAAYTRFPP